MSIILIITVITITAASQDSSSQKELVGQFEKRSICGWGTPVAFSVRTVRKIPISSVLKTIRFDEVLLNMGGGYSSSSGVFVVPVTGVYLFTVNIRAVNSGTGGWVHLMKNHKVIAYVYDNNAGGNSNQVIVKARKGEHVFARLMPNYGIWDHVEPYNTMSGILLIPG